MKITDKIKMNQTIMGDVIDWPNYPIATLPKRLALYLADEDLFIKYSCYQGKGDSFEETTQWVTVRLIKGEIGIFLGYRIIIKEDEL